ncbi:hypothetical protein BJX68DRAFT_266974 [Aspergillus pseudodeflectus]|uniref:Secreted protein n=1 Tax=Aspergillus pseudodeflectus TaxID=176178 RepID=A0ABR4KD10_9EURO
MDASDIIQYIVVPVIAVIVGAITIAILCVRHKQKQKRLDLEHQRLQQTFATPWIPDAQQPIYQMQHQAFQQEKPYQQSAGGIPSHVMVQYPSPVAQGPPGYYAPDVHGQQQ